MSSWCGHGTPIAFSHVMPHSANLSQVLSLEVPIMVLLGERTCRVSEVTALVPGSIIEIPKHADDELLLLVNNRTIGVGKAVKVGENFGLRITRLGAQPATHAEETDKASADKETKESPVANAA